MFFTLYFGFATGEYISCFTYITIYLLNKRKFFILFFQLLINVFVQKSVIESLVLGIIIITKIVVNNTALNEFMI